MQSERMSRQARVLATVQEYTQALLSSPEDHSPGIHAGLVADQLHMDRANVARELNNLYRNGQLIKLQGKPTLYLCRSVLSAEYPNVFFPSTLPKGTTIQEHLTALAQPRTQNASQNNQEGLTSNLETLAGAHGTLKSAILHAKAAALYPSHDLHALITGSVGVGKALLAHEMYTYAVSKGSLAADAPFIVVNCKEHNASPQLFMNQLFGCTRDAAVKGEKAQRGLIERAAGGILCLNGIEKLPAAVQDALITLLEKNTYTRMGEASVVRYSSAMVIALSTETPDASSIAALRQRFSVRIHIPDLNTWNPREIAELLIQAFQKEASSTGLSFRISRETFALFLRASYPGNLGDLTSTVRTTCALVFQDFISASPRPRTMEIRLHHLQPELLQSVQENAPQEMQIHRLFRELDLEYLIFNPNTFSSNRFVASHFLKRLQEGTSPTEDASSCVSSLSSGAVEASELHTGPIPVLAIFHGHHIAEAMADYVNSSLGVPNVTGISIPESMPFQELLDKASATARQLDQGRGVLLAVDMDPLTNLHEYLLKATGIHAETISNVSLPLLLSIGQLALQEDIALYDLSQKIMTATNNHNALPETSFLHRITKEILEPSLTFLNPYKAMDALSTALNNVLKELNIVPSNEITMKFISHGSHMLERLITGDSLKYAGLKPFVNEHNLLIAILEKHMSHLCEVFGVSVPVNELAYLAEILVPYLG